MLIASINFKNADIVLNSVNIALYVIAMLHAKPAKQLVTWLSFPMGIAQVQFTNAPKSNPLKGDEQSLRCLSSEILNSK